MTWEKLFTTGISPSIDCRLSHSTTYHDHKIYVLDSKLSMHGKISSIDLFILDLQTYAWTSKKTAGALPPTLTESSTTFVNGNIFTYGGADINGQYNNALHCLNLSAPCFLFCA